MILCLALFFFGSIQSGTPCGFMDIAPNHSSEINTVATFFSSCTGFITPIIISSLQNLCSSNQSLAWQISFYLTFLVCMISIIIWKYWCITEIIPELNN